MKEATSPVDVLNANLRRLGRDLSDATITGQQWQGNEYGLQIVWADGFAAFVGFGPIASAMVDAHGQTMH